ncbi:peptidase M48 [Arachidicoccus ginsenosidimutans]|uniref:M48 family metallopeptidase n=1 Tax=Arachidicoccus sp. BS20 TaxID=1850526 RepID=UPI0007F0D676|nr:M48 family metallopeptidase [Arachidicoccus sp. BS20]ANI88073.1 peptidase M48 [Arachidicoccus sp. BS20]
MKLKYFSLAVISSITIMSCATNAITGRKQLSLVSDGEMESMALTQYKDFLNENKVVPATTADATMVKRVGQRIAVAITKYYASKGQSNALNGYKWEFNLVQSKEVNAWCMPGGKVVVYTGLLPVTKDEASLAIVLGHEITHAVAGHGKERYSQELLAQGLQSVGGAALGTNPKAVSIFNSVYAPSAQVGVLLPNSRKQELEADHYGLIFAAMAGYDPRVAVPFWQRMAALGANGQKPPAMLSDHPSDAQRIAAIQQLMPEALKYYQGNK